MVIAVPSLACAGLLAAATPACSASQSGAESPAPSASRQTAGLDAARAALLDELRAEGIESEAVLDALREVPRERFVPERYRAIAYGNHPLPIGYEQTISQPFVVALMTQLLELAPSDKVLEIGTGSGYQAAVLAELDAEVYTIEIVEPLADRAAALLHELGYEGVHVRHGDGYLGWPEEAPFDKIIVTAAPEQIPAPLVEQLRTGGKMIIPVGPQGGVQQLTLLEKDANGEVNTTAVIPVAFVPMVR